MSLRHQLKKKLWKLGWDISRFDVADHPIGRRGKLFRYYGISCVLDVGANVGQYGMQLREMVDYKGKIVSFEPLSGAFAELSNAIKDDPLWSAHNYALGDVDGASEINISENSFSSSMLELLPKHAEAAPNSTYVGKEMIEIRMLDSVINGLGIESDSVYLKIDAQGFEAKVLEGGKRSLRKIATIQLELSVAPLYENQSDLVDIYAFLKERGYLLVSVEPGFTDPDSGEMLQFDGIFHRAEVSLLSCQ